MTYLLSGSSNSLNKTGSPRSRKHFKIEVDCWKHNWSTLTNNHKPLERAGQGKDYGHIIWWYLVICLVISRMLRDLLQVACFVGNVLSLLIVRCLIRLGSPLKLTFLNQLFLIYYAIDAIVGSAEINFLFELKEER